MFDDAAPPFEPEPEQTAPYNLDAEKGVIGAVLIDARLYGRVADTIKASDFYRDAHRQIWDAISTLKANNNTVDLLTLTDDLKKRGTLDECGGPAYIAGLIDGVPHSANIDAYARIVSESSSARRLMAAALRARTRAADGDASADVIAELENELADLAAARAWQSSVTPIQTIQSDALEELDRRVARADSASPIGVPTGFSGLDDMTSGLQPTDLILLAGRTSMGKTSLALNIAENVCLKKPESVVLMFSLEMSKVQVYNRMLSSLARVEGIRIRSGRLTEMDMRSISEAGVKINDMRIWVDETSTLSPFELLGRARRLRMDVGRLDLVIVDYIQLMHSSGKHDSRQQEVSAISRSLKAAAKELGVPILALAQLSRAVDARKDKEPILSDLRESGSLEQDADVVVFIHRAEMYERTDENAGIAKAIVAKQRNGPTGTCDLVFISEFSRFDNMKMF